MDRCLSTCLSQADQLLESLEDEVRKSIQTDYGKDEGLTSLWNATMTQVLYLTFVTSDPSLEANFVLGLTRCAFPLVSVLRIQELHRFRRLPF